MLREGGPTRKSWWKGITTLGLLFVLSSGVSSQSMRLQDAPLGSVVQIGSYNYVKIAENKYMQSTQVTCPDGATVGGKYVKCFADKSDYESQCLEGCTCTLGTLQTFTTEMCASYATPTGTHFTEIGWFQDNRDGKWYEVRKFADGVCWMVTNLKYGGTNDACAQRTSFTDGVPVKPTNRFGTGTYGDCRNNPGSDDYGYFYNWHAAMQAADAYHGNDYAGPQSSVTGLCPAGWILPTSNSTTTKGSFGFLHVQAGSPMMGFWQPGGNWKGAYSGSYNVTDDIIEFQGSRGYTWSSTQYDSTHAYYLLYSNSSNVLPANHAATKARGFPIRCLHF